jgi:hypothetical protein
MSAGAMPDLRRIDEPRAPMSALPRECGLQRRLSKLRPRSMARAAFASLQLGALAAVVVCKPAWGNERANYFGDPFLQVTKGIADCPVPEGPLITEAEMRAQAHVRSERGTRCFMSGQCRLPNAYLYDREIIPRVEKSILADGRFADTSVWAEGQRRWVFLKGCVRRKEQSVALERLVRGIDDVEAVINQLVIRRR